MVSLIVNSSRLYKTHPHLEQSLAKTCFFSCNSLPNVFFISFQLWENITHHFHNNIYKPAFINNKI